MQLDCGQISFTNGTTEDGLGCLCADNFEWNSTLHLCVIQCDQITDPLGLGVNLNSYSCQCQDGSSWEKVLNACKRKCTSIPNSTGANVNAEECECEVNYQWNSDGSCDSVCGSKHG